MYNKLNVESLSSQTSTFTDYVNKNVVDLDFQSASSVGITQDVASMETKSLVDLSVPISVDGSILTIAENTSSTYKLSLDTGYFNTPINTSITGASVVNIASSEGIATIFCSDFDLSGVSAGDMLVFHENENSLVSELTQGNVVKIVGVDSTNKKIYVNDPYGFPSENVVITSTDYFSVFQNEITSTHTVSLSDNFKEKNIGYYNIQSATDKYLIIHSEKKLIEDDTTLSASSLSVFSQVIDSIFFKTNVGCEIIIDSSSVFVNTKGVGVFATTSKCSSISVRNTSENVANITLIYSTTADSITACGG